ncbi:Protein Y45F10D.1 putative [Phytophthora palmivora]|uniref:Protein Y45F10D.1 putative n=1 Tax=Phytophthora palmivora TaxID=4796 RepID=A0A2P4Y6X8_9STRA|nr:Protein Y45F10D.1 putative [Phytophthora palmivora]
MAVKEERGSRSDTGGERPRAGKFAAELKTELGFKTSVRTVQKLLQRVDHLVYTKMDHTLPLTTAHKTARMRWAEEHILNSGKLVIYVVIFLC